MSHVPPRTLVSPQHRSRAHAAASCTIREETQAKSSHRRESTGQWGSKNLHMTD